MSDVFNDIQSSILRFCNDFITSRLLPEFQVFDFDAHATVERLPPKNLIGIAEFGLVNEDKTYIATMMILVSTLATDGSNVILKKTLGQLFDALRPGTNISAVRATDGQLTGHLVVKAPVEVLPVMITEGRPVQAIALSVGSSFLIPP